MFCATANIPHPSSAAIFPGQAILLSRMMDVFTLSGDAMKERGNFFASMFIVLAAGCLVVYFVLGWGVNVVAQVCRPVPSSLALKTTDLPCLRLVDPLA